MKTIQYFGYGSLRNRRFIKEIIGRDPGVGRSAIIRGYQLGFQSLRQIPADVSAQLRSIWGEAFKAYTLIKGNGVVSGVVWELTQDELLRLEQWNFSGVWRHVITEHAILEDNSEMTVCLDVALPGQGIEGIVYNGIEGYPNLINDIVEGKIVLDEFRREQDHEITNAREMLKLLSDRSAETAAVH
jgi:hypothetical protein